MSSATNASPGGATDDRWSNLAVNSLRLLAGWFGLVTRYQRQNPKARVSEATSALISRAVAAALKLVKQDPRHIVAVADPPPQSPPAGNIAVVNETLQQDGTSTGTDTSPTYTPTTGQTRPGQSTANMPTEANVSHSPTQTGAGRAEGSEVVAAALAALGAALELVDDKQRIAAQDAAVSLVPSHPFPAEKHIPPAAHPRPSASGRISVLMLSEHALGDLFSAWLEFVTHPPHTVSPLRNVLQQPQLPTPGSTRSAASSLVSSTNAPDSAPASRAAATAGGSSGENRDGREGGRGGGCHARGGGRRARTCVCLHRT